MSLFKYMLRKNIIIPKFVIDGWMMRDLVRILTPGADEEMVYLTGPKLKQVRVISRICPLEYEEQSPVYVRATKASSVDKLIEIGDNGAQLHCVAHCHPGTGAAATTPSDIDKRYMKGLQDGMGAEAIGIIVTRDGFVRFFTVSLPYNLTITGYFGVWKAVPYQNVYKVSKTVGQLPPEATGRALLRA